MDRFGSPRTGSFLAARAINVAANLRDEENTARVLPQPSIIARDRPTVRNEARNRVARIYLCFDALRTNVRHRFFLGPSRARLDALTVQRQDRTRLSYAAGRDPPLASRADDDGAMQISRAPRALDNAQLYVNTIGSPTARGRSGSRREAGCRRAEISPSTSNSELNIRLSLTRFRSSRANGCPRV